MHLSLFLSDFEQAFKYTEHSERQKEPFKNVCGIRPLKIQSQG